MTKIEEYNKLVFGKKPKNKKKKFPDDERLEKMLRIALENRKLELELTWKRATYFSIFIGAIAIAFTAILNAENFDNPFLNLLLPLLGYIFSFAWFLANKGSKFWQENWEAHSDILARQFLGNISNILLKETGKTGLFNGASYSVSKTSIAVSFIITVTWFLFFLMQVWIILIDGNGLSSNSNVLLWFQTFILVTAILTPILLYNFCRSTFAKKEPQQFSSKDIEYFDLKKFEKKT